MVIKAILESDDLRESAIFNIYEIIPPIKAPDERIILE